MDKKESRSKRHSILCCGVPSTSQLATKPTCQHYRPQVGTCMPSVVLLEHERPCLNVLIGACVRVIGMLQEYNKKYKKGENTFYKKMMAAFEAAAAKKARWALACKPLEEPAEDAEGDDE
eukprot:2645740-Amphidinium_carterae.1